MSVILRLAGEEPVELNAVGESYMRAGGRGRGVRPMRFPSGLTAHLHLSWLDPHKERRFTVVGSKRMATFDDMEPERKLTVYDKGFDQDFSSYGEYIARSGDVSSPRISNEEPLRIECRHFIECVRDGTEPRSGGECGAARGARARGAAASLRRARVLREPSDRAPGLLLGGRVCCPRRRDRRRRGDPRRHAVGARGAAAGRRRPRQAGGARRPSQRRGGEEPGPPVVGEGATICAGAVVVAGARSARRCVVGDQAHVRERAVIGEESPWGPRPSVDNDVVIGERVRIQTGCYITASRSSRTTSSSRPGVFTTNDNTMGRRSPDFELAGRRCGAPAGWAAGAVLLPGVEVGEEAFVAAGAVVTRDVAPRRAGDGGAGQHVREVPTRTCWSAGAEPRAAHARAARRAADARDGRGGAATVARVARRGRRVWRRGLGAAAGETDDVSRPRRAVVEPSRWLGPATRTRPRARTRPSTCSSRS